MGGGEDYSASKSSLAILLIRLASSNPPRLLVPQIQFHGEAITSLFGELAAEGSSIRSPSGSLSGSLIEDEYEDDLHPPDPEEKKMGVWRTGAVRAVKFYSAPFVKFGLDIVSYILLLSLYCYVLLHFRAGKCRLLTNRQISY